MSAVFSLPTCSPKSVCPLSFGDVVRGDFDSLGLIHVPDLGIPFALMMDVTREFAFTNSKPSRRMVDWDLVFEIVGLPAETAEHLEQYRRCVVLNESHWDRGIEFLSPTAIASLATGDIGSLHLGDQRNVAEFFGESVRDHPDEFRVLVHTASDWCTWKCLGLMTKTGAEALVGRLESMFRRPRERRRGVYVSDSETMNKFELWSGLHKVAEHSWVVGQGEN